MGQDQRSGDAIADRLRLALSAESDGALSRSLGISPATISSWRNRDSRPYALCIDLAERHGLSLDWLLTGAGDMRRGGGGSAPDVDGTREAPGTYVPEGLSADGRRIDALLGLLAGLDPASRAAVLTDCFARATHAQQMTELRLAVQRLEAKVGG